MEPSDPKKSRDAEASETPTPKPFSQNKEKTSESEASTPADAASTHDQAEGAPDNDAGKAEIASDEAPSLPKTVVDLKADSDTSADPDKTETETESADTSTGGSKGATLSQPPADIAAASATTDAGEDEEKASSTEAPAQKTTETKGAILHEPPDVAKAFAGTDETSGQARESDAEMETEAEDQPVAEAEPVIDLPEEDTEPVAEADPVIGLPPEDDAPDQTEASRTDETDVEAEREPVAEAGAIQTEPLAEKEPVGGALDLNDSDLDTLEEDTDVSEKDSGRQEEDTGRTALDDVAAPAVGMTAGAGSAAAAGRTEDREELTEDREELATTEEPETVEASTPRVETFETASSDEPEPETIHGTLEPATPAAAAPTASAARDAPKADVGKRFIAYIIDAVIAMVLGFVPTVGGILGAAYFIVRDGLDFDFMKQRSLGKKLMKLRPVRLDGQAMDLEASFKRNWMFGLGALGAVPFVGWLLSLIVILPALAIGLYELYRVFTDPEGRRWGDDLATTKVIEVDE